jgi:hypothetical protein
MRGGLQPPGLLLLLLLQPLLPLLLALRVVHCLGVQDHATSSQVALSDFHVQLFQCRDTGLEQTHMTEKGNCCGHRQPMRCLHCHRYRTAAAAVLLLLLDWLRRLFCCK